MNRLQLSVLKKLQQTHLPPKRPRWGVVPLIFIGSYKIGEPCKKGHLGRASNGTSIYNILYVQSWDLVSNGDLTCLHKRVGSSSQVLCKNT